MRMYCGKIGVINPARLQIQHFRREQSAEADRPRRADDDLGELFALNVFEDLQERREAQLLQLVFRQFEFADRPEVFQRNIVDGRILSRGHNDELFPRSGARPRHFANGGGDTVDIFERVGKPRAFSILQRRRDFAGEIATDLPQPPARRRLAVKSVNVRREHDEQRSDPAQCLDTFHDIAGANLLNEFFEKTKRELFAHEICHEERAPLRFGHAFHLAREHFLHLRFGEGTGKLFPERNVRRFRQLKNFSRHHTLRDEAGFLTEREFRRIFPFHETRKHLPQQRRRRSEIFCEPVLNETGERVVKTVRKKEGSSTLAVDRAFAGADSSQEFRGGLCTWRFGKGGGDKHSAVIVRTGGKDFLPRFGMGRSEIMSIRELVDFLRR